jgi:hypothetical protein
MDPSKLREFGSIAFGLLASAVVCANYSVLLRRSGLIVPFVGGLAGAVAVALWPAAGLWKWCWIPLVIDYGSLPSLFIVFFRPRPRPALDQQTKDALLAIAGEVLRGERPSSDLERYGIRIGPERGGEEVKRQLLRELGIDDDDPAAPDHVRAHKYCQSNRELVLKSETCGCFHCLSIMPAKSVAAWRESDQTALCPKCGEDTLIPLTSGFPVTVTFLKQMRRKWFEDLGEPK